LSGPDYSCTSVIKFHNNVERIPMIEKRLTTLALWKSLFGIASLLIGSLSAAQAAKVTLGWDAQPAVDGYRVHYGTVSGNYTQTSDVGKSTAATILNLAAGQTYYFVVTAYNSAGMESQVSDEISFNSFKSSLFSDSDKPATVTVDEPNPIEVGVKFQTSTAGQVTGFRFYKGPQNTGAHIANLWSTTGTLLATATFTDETPAGWQQVNLSTPVTLAPGTTYIVSYHTNGLYSASPAYFSSAHTNGALTALANSTSNGNGVYAYGSSSQFPTNSSNATNYWVDIVLKQF
jgi:hypothetical protein